MTSVPSRADAPQTAATVVPASDPHVPIGVLVCGHGSRNRLAVAEFAGLAEQLRDRGLEPVGGNRDAARDFLAAEGRKWAEVARRANYRPE